MGAYKKITKWSFEINDDFWLLSKDQSDPRKLYVEEARKNGQEDTHMGCELFLADNGYWLVDEEWENISEYHYGDTVEKIEKYINKHGVPND